VESSWLVNQQEKNAVSPAALDKLSFCDPFQKKQFG
jgi:hypothetical protein